MPRYPWMIANELDKSQTKDKIVLMKNVFGVPYSQAQVDSLDSWVKNQAVGIAKRIVSEDSDIKKSIDAEKAEKGKDFIPLENREVVALIAYLQRLGTDIKTTEIKTASNN